MPKLRKSPAAPRSASSAVTALLVQLGANLRLARTRRGLSMEAAAEAIGCGARAVRSVELGSPSASIKVSLALLHHYGLDADVSRLAEPGRDVEGLRLSGGREFKRARRGRPPVAPAAPTALPNRRQPAPLQVEEAVPGVPANVVAGLSAGEREALRLLQRNGSARATELARALPLPANRVGGMMRELKRKLHAQGAGAVLTDETLPGGEVLYRFARGARS